MSTEPHLRVYRFGTAAKFEGELVAALERMQLSGDGKLLDALFVQRDAEGALAAVDLATGARDSTFASMLDFRLDEGRRRALTERTLTEHRGGVPRALIEAIAGDLAPGTAVLAMLHTGARPTVFEDAVTRCDGTLVADEPAAAHGLGEVAPQLRAAATAE